jgi:inosine-uridine nucleoside N-ribohydrolase
MHLSDRNCMRRLKVGLATVALGASSLATVAVPLGAEAAAGPQHADDAKHPGRHGPVRLIFDTDFGGDVDDTGALGMLNAFEDNHEVKLLALMASNPGTEWAAGGMDAINTYYRHGNIPLGVRDRGSHGERMPNVSSYAEDLAKTFPNDTGDGARLPDATDLYRRILARQPNHSVTVTVVGSQSNLQNLLNSGPDRYSRLTGTQLVDRKVTQLVVMGSTCLEAQDWAEWNIALDPPAAAQVAQEWPTRIVYSGFEVGDTIYTGSRLFTETPVTNPVRRAYRDYVGEGNDRNSWDITAAYYAVRGSRTGLFGLSEPGVNQFDPNDGMNTFVPNPDGHHYCMTTLVPDEQIATALEDLMVQAPRQGHHPRR